LSAGLLPLRVGDQALVEEEICQRYAFFWRTRGAVAQIEDQLPGALFFKLGDLGPDVLYPARRERHRLDHTNRLGALVGHQPRAYGREYERSADQCEFLRLGPPDAQHAHLNRG